MPDADPAVLRDPDRLAAVEAVGWTASAADDALDRAARLVRRCLRVPVALVSVVEADRQVFPAHDGLPEPWCSLGETPLSHSFCQHVVALDAPLVVEDARSHPLVHDNAAIDALDVRAYLGVPLRTPDGHVVGSLCAIDGRPRPWSDADREALEAIAEVVTDEVARRYRAGRETEALAEAGTRAERLFRALFDGSHSLLGLLRPDGALVGANRTALAFAQATPEALVGRPLWESLPLPDDVAGRHREAVARAARGETVRYEETVTDASGRGVVLDVTLRPAPGEEGLLLLEGRDVTEAVRLRRLQSAVQAGGGGTWELDLRSDAVSTDGGTDGLFGLDPGGGPHPAAAYFGRVHPDDLERVRAAIAASVEAVGEHAVEYRVVRPDGSVRHLRSRGVVVAGPDGAPARMVGALADVTDERREAAELRRSRRRLQLALVAARLGTFSYDPATDDHEVDARAREVLGLPETVTADGFLAHVHPDDREATEAFVARVSGGTRRPLQNEYRIVRPDGAVRWVSSTAWGRTGPDGAVRVLGTIRDVTDRRRAEATLRAGDARNALLLGLAQAWRVADSAREVMDTTAEALGRHLGAHRVGFFETRASGGGPDGAPPDTFDFGAGASWSDGSLPPLPGTLPFGAIGARYLDEARAGRTLATTDAETDPLTAGSAFGEMGVRSGIGAPILRDGAFAAGLYVHDAEPRAWTEAEVAVTREVADQAWDAVERVRARRALDVSEARLQAILDATAAVVFTKDLDGRYTLVNRAFREVFGVEPADVLGQTDHAFLPAATADALRANDRTVAEAGHPVQVEEQAEVGGEARTYLSVKFPLRDPGGAVTAVGGISTDITEVKRAQRALAASEARFRATFENAAVGIAVVGPDGTALESNARLAELLGVAPEAMGGLTFQEVTHPDDLDTDLALFRRLLAGEIPHYQIEKRYRRADGTWVWATLTVAPNPSPDGAVGSVVSIVEDVTEKKAAEAALRRLNDELEVRVAARTAELERSNAELDQFAYVASHDLKAPLRAIDSLAAWIEEDASDALPDESRRHLALLRARADRMEGLLDGLLAYSRAGRREAAPEPLALGDLVREAVAVMAPPEGFDVRLGDELAGYGPAAAFPEMVAARAPLALVVRNLVGNAIKHHDRPDGRVTVSARVVEGDGREWAEVSVADDGPGIAEPYQDRVFAMFQTLRPRDEVEGSGMGLAVVKKTVESWGGSVSVASEGRGATFRFTWPLRPGPDRPAT